MNHPERQILFMNPVFTHNIWGGTRLKEEFGYAVEGDDIGECWGIAAHENGDCTIREGEFEGKRLSQLWKEKPELFGNFPADRFPLLVKIIDAKEDLSIQVHPDDAYAAEHENGSLGKTECWYVIDCPREASLVIGHNAKNKNELADMIREGDWTGFIREVPVKKGDFIQIEPGTVHAIKGGFLLLETQQNSDITYRVYDYDRKCGGKLRELHVEQSIDVITVPALPEESSTATTRALGKNTLHKLISCAYYTVYKASVDGRMNFVQDRPFLLVSVLEGSGTVNCHEIKKGDHFILPCGYGEVEIAGKLQIIASTAEGKTP